MCECVCVATGAARGHSERGRRQKAARREARREAGRGTRARDPDTVEPHKPRGRDTRLSSDMCHLNCYTTFHVSVSIAMPCI